MTEIDLIKAAEARRDYQRAYRKKNKKKIAKYQKEWRKKNPEKIKEINARYWAKKAGE